LSRIVDSARSKFQYSGYIDSDIQPASTSVCIAAGMYSGIILTIYN